MKEFLNYDERSWVIWGWSFWLEWEAHRWRFDATERCVVHKCWRLFWIEAWASPLRPARHKCIRFERVWAKAAENISERVCDALWRWIHNCPAASLWPRANIWTSTRTWLDATEANTWSLFRLETTGPMLVGSPCSKDPSRPWHLRSFLFRKISPVLEQNKQKKIHFNFLSVNKIK